MNDDILRQGVGLDCYDNAAVIIFYMYCSIFLNSFVYGRKHGLVKLFNVWNKLPRVMY